jgi:putative transposase
LYPREALLPINFRSPRSSHRSATGPLCPVLKVENRILRDRLPPRITVTAQERQRLLKYGKLVGKAIAELITIVTPRTFARWLSGEVTAKKSRPANPGRPRTRNEVRELVLRLARETGWGYTRILGELKKLGVRKISRATVLNILRANGLEPGPKRGEGTWDEFLKQHAATLWACDFFTKKVWTTKGLVEMFVLFFIHVGSRRVNLAGITAQPDAAWMSKQARNVAIVFGEQANKPQMLLRDHDTKFTQQFDAILDAEEVEVKAVGLLAPNMNAVAERWVQSVQQECLDHFLVFGEAHLRYILNKYLARYHRCWPHQGLDNNLLDRAETPAAAGPLSADAIVCEERLGELLKRYH